MGAAGQQAVRTRRQLCDVEGNDLPGVDESRAEHGSAGRSRLSAHHGSVDIGALSLLSTGSGGLSPAQILDAQVLAQIAAVQVLRRSHTAQTLKTKLHRF